jgi:hypothetical protein
MFRFTVVSSSIRGLGVLVGGLTAVLIVAGCDTAKVAALPHTGTSRDSAEQVMYGARSVLASSGLRRGEVTGDTVMSFAANTRFEFRGLRASFTTTLGRPLGILTAPAGTYRIPSGILEAHGSVAIASDTSRRRLDGVAIRYDPTKNQFSSDSAFTVTGGMRRLSGVGFTADPGLFSVKCAQQCTGSLAP